MAAIARRALLGATLAATPAFAQSLRPASWRPARSVTILVPFAAGSGTDALSRILAGLLEPIWGQPVVVENRAGANGALAAGAAARAAPDGTTLMMTTNTPSAANPALMKKLDYDPVADFSPLSRTGNFNFWLVVPTASPFRSVAELLAAARAKPGDISYASGNSTGIVAGGAIAAQAGVQMTHVPYRSTPPAITDVIAGRVSCMVVDVSSSLGNVKGGQLRALGVTTRQRSKLLPDIPALDEVGLPGFDVAAWAGLIGPARMPAAMVQSINADVRSVWDRPETVQRLADIGFDGFSSAPEEFGGFIRDEIVKWARMARAAGIEPE